MEDGFNFRSLNGLHHGERYEFEEFRKRYSLDINQATNLFERFGPSAVELDLLMAAKQRRTQGAPT